MKQWTEERLAHMPEELEVIAPGLYMQRKDITRVDHEKTEEMEAYTEYVCMSREITESEHEMLKSIEEINTTAAIDAYTEELIKEGMI